MRRALALVLACALAPALAAPLARSETVPSVGPGAYASPHEAAFDVAERLIDTDGRVRSQLGGTPVVSFVRDAMLAVLVELHRAELLNETGGDHVKTAERVWSNTENAYHASDKYYDVTLTSRSICVPLEPNAWALLAADALGAATAKIDYRTRASALSKTLAEAVQSGAVGDVPRCPGTGDLPPSEWPLPLWALVRHAKSDPSGAAARSVALARLDQELAVRWHDAVQDPSGLYLAAVNAQYLLLLQAAETADPGHYADKVEALQTFLRTRATRGSDPDFGVRTLDANRTPLGDPDPAAQVWAAVALRSVAERLPQEAADVPARLLDDLVRRSWSTREGALAYGAAAPDAALNLLLALATSGPSVAKADMEGARVGFVVPNELGFTYPDASTADPRYYESNEWTFRFTLNPYGPSTQPVLLPLDRIGPIRHNLPPSAYAPAPTLQRGGSTLAVATDGLEHPLLRFNAVLRPVAGFRLQDYAPVVPVSSEFERDVRLYLLANATLPVPVDLLQLDLEARNVTIDTVRFNDRLLGPGEFEAADASATESLPVQHVRISVKGVELRPDVVNEVIVGYTDSEKPVITDVVVTSDAAGTDPLPSKEDKAGVRTYIASAGSQPYVRATVHDNAALKVVTVAIGQGANLTERPLAPTARDASLFVGRLPVLALRKPVPVEVRASDQHGTLATVGNIVVLAQLPFLRAGDPVLLVFSATLFVAAAGIWWKMGRRRRHG